MGLEGVYLGAEVRIVEKSRGGALTAFVDLRPGWFLGAGGGGESSRLSDG